MCTGRSDLPRSALRSASRSGPSGVGTGQTNEADPIARNADVHGEHSLVSVGFCPTGRILPNGCLWQRRRLRSVRTRTIAP